jgi:acyl carrier protein
MSEKATDIANRIRDYILREFLPGESPETLSNNTPLITGGILDSISTIKLVAFLEAEFGVEMHPHEMSPDYLDTVELIATLVAERISS